jgi:hypothetical protein
MKALFAMALAVGAAFLTGCETTAVVERPYYGDTRIYYSSGRPYYYTGGVRYWGYPRGYSGYRGYGYRGDRYRDYDGPRYGYRRNVEVERNTYVVNNRTVVRNRDRDVDYRSNRSGDVRYRSGDVSRRTNVKVKNPPPGQVKKKKYRST